MDLSRLGGVGEYSGETAGAVWEIQSDLRGGHRLERPVAKHPSSLVEDKRVSGEFHFHRSGERLEFFSEPKIRMERPSARALTLLSFAIVRRAGLLWHPRGGTCGVGLLAISFARLV